VTNSTESLIEGLADGLVPVPEKLLERRLGLAVAGGAVVVLALVIGVIGLRPDLVVATSDTRFWTKLFYTGAIALTALAAALRLARPETTGVKATYFAAPVGILVLMAMFELSAAAPDQRSALVFGDTWRECPLIIAGLSLPLLAILLRLFAGFAPQRPRLTGAIIGVVSGATAATLYSLHCPEMAMTFLLLWYSAGIAIIAAIGAMVGPRFLRW
jgi:hypothetical protein